MITLRSPGTSSAPWSTPAGYLLFQPTPGERLEYAVVSPRAAGHAGVDGRPVLANRILGFVNAPALMQRVVAGLTEAASISPPMLGLRRDLFCQVLPHAGYGLFRPKAPFISSPRRRGATTWPSWPAETGEYPGGAGPGLWPAGLFPSGLSACPNRSSKMPPRALKALKSLG